MTAGKTKGNNWETDCGYTISMWISEMKRGDLVRRSVLSGGRYTRALQLDKATGQAGDLAPDDPLAFPFFGQVVIECKHWAYIELIDFVWETKELYHAMLKVKEEARATGKMWMLIPKQNRKPPLCMLPTSFKLPTRGIRYHRLFEDTVYLIKFYDLVDHMTVDKFIELAKDAHD